MPGSDANLFTTSSSDTLKVAFVLRALTACHGGKGLRACDVRAFGDAGGGEGWLSGSLFALALARLKCEQVNFEVASAYFPAVFYFCVVFLNFSPASRIRLWSENGQ